MKAPRIPFLAFFLGALSLAAFSAYGGQAATESDAAQPSALRIVFFTPADLSVPAGARRRLTQIAAAAEKFYFDWMKHWGYPPAATNLFQRGPDGLVEMLEVKGDLPVASHKYDDPNYASYVVTKARRQFHLADNGDVWWIFIYLGDPPARFEDFRGAGNAHDGGTAMVNYDSRPGEIRSDIGLADGFNGKFFLKGCVHELGHAFGLPHVGPDPSLGLGNSLMGPTTKEYIRRNGPKPDLIYLSESSAARLWKHSIFSGSALDRKMMPSVKLVNYKADYDAKKDCIKITGKLISDRAAHSVIVTDDLGKPRDQYWVRGHTARLAADGTFQVAIDRPSRTSGHYRIEFCFDNGIVTGDGVHFGLGNRGEIRKPYRFAGGKFEFDNE